MIFEIFGNSFLPHQVRSIVGGLVEVGLGNIKVEDFIRMARSKKTGVMKHSVPARGLCLIEVLYPSFPLQGKNENV